MGVDSLPGRPTSDPFWPGEEFSVWDEIATPFRFRPKFFLENHKDFNFQKKIRAALKRALINYFFLAKSKLKNWVKGQTLTGSDGALPPDPALLVRGDSASCQNLQLDQAGADKEADDWVQVDLKLGGSSRWRQCPGGNLRQARPVVRSRFVNVTISGNFLGTICHENSVLLVDASRQK